MTVPSRRRLVAAEAYGLDGSHAPVMTIVGEVISVKPAEAGAGVSYGYSYHTDGETILALVALGYADGVPRLASNRASVHVGGALHPLVGRVAMDQFVVDCGSSSAVAVGDAAVLFGDAAAGHPLAIDWAAQTGRSPLELTAGIGSRVLRVSP
jgi:alanine racemase